MKYQTEGDKFRFWRETNPEKARLLYEGNGVRVRKLWDVCPETFQERIRAKAKKNPALQSGAQNRFAKDWFLKTPSGVSVRCRCLMEFIRTRPELFSPEDLEPRPQKNISAILKLRRPDRVKSRAAWGLYGLSPRCKHPAGSWKGWTWDHEAAMLALPPV